MKPKYYQSFVKLRCHENLERWIPNYEKKQMSDDASDRQAHHLSFRRRYLSILESETSLCRSVRLSDGLSVGWSVSLLYLKEADRLIEGRAPAYKKYDNTSKTTK